MDNLLKFQNIMRDVFQDDTIEITPQTTANDIEGWDSLSHVNLLLAIEIEFGIEFAPAEIRKMDNVGDLLTLINSKTGKN
jgi:acyl carrier protein